MRWTEVLNTKIPLEAQVQALPTKGNLVYEYNPFRNYRLSESKYHYKNDYYSLEELELQFNITLSADKQQWLQKGLPLTGDYPVLYEKGQLIDFISDELHFSLEHPVHIIPQASYDGSVNLIINDGLNIPRMINSRFSATGKNTYEIIDRKGNNDTNIYDQGSQFDIDTSLYKRVIQIPKIQFNGTQFGGNLKVGNYHFYFKLSDADGNETDFIGESGLVSVFIGYDSPDSVHTGTKNENSFKQVNFQLSNIDTAYDTVYVYYSRYTAEGGENFITEYKKITKKFIVNNLGYANIIVTGFEEAEDLTASDINLSYNVVDSAFTSATCQNMLFLANVHKPDIPYKELSDLSLRFLPYLKQENYSLQMDQDYVISSVDKGYYDSKFIYDKTGYWAGEIYRFGIVYIMPNGELTPVFNIRGGCNVGEFSEDIYSNIDIRDPYNERIYINYNDETYEVLTDDNEGSVPLENVKGVVKFKATQDSDIIYGVDIRAKKEVIEELKQYVKGYFFVRQTRIPTILAQGITVGIDKEARVPCIPTKDGIINELSNLENTYVETKDTGKVNYISEGFLARYSYTLKAKGGFFKILSTVLSAIATVASFLPGAGTFVALAANAADFLITTAVTGKFQTAAFVSTLISSAAIGGANLAKVITKTTTNLEKAAKWSKTAEKLVKVTKNINNINKLNTFSDNALKVSRALNMAVSAVKTVDTATTIASQLNGASYEGRNTKIPKGFEKKENQLSRSLKGDFLDRIIIKDGSKVDVQGIICPDYEINQPYFNQIFTGNKHTLKYNKSQGINFENRDQAGSNYFNNNYRHFYHSAYYDSDIEKVINSKIIGVPDSTKCIGLSNLLFRSRAGEAEEAFRYEFVGRKYEDSKEIKENTDIVRGNFGAYLAVDTNQLDPATVVNIMIPEYSDAKIDDYFSIRMNDSSSFFAISDRIDIRKQQEYWMQDEDPLKVTDENGYRYVLFRGDCYLCQFTHRLNRNFNDPSAPYNDKIVDPNSWRDNFDPDNTEKYAEINLGDVNAVQLGMWVTFKLRSSYNLNIRTLDGSNVDESAMTGHSRGYFPYYPMVTDGSFKHSESQIYNKGFSKSVSERWNFELPDVPHIKNFFKTRIMYSDIHINDAYKNGFRVFRGQNYRDYTREYGEIVKLVPFESSLLCVFEHGVALIPINERAVAGQGAGGNVYINTSNVLPENPKIISDMFGSQWPESVLKVPGKTGDAPQYVYGVDTIAKKIWRTDGNTLECISDFKVQEFLNNNITLGERELTPKIGIRNVKTHYNAFKRDVMFTFYDNTYGFEEKVWNLCWNEILQKFITFYSWVPSYMENINNIPFSFDRNTSKWLAKLGTSHTESSFADGITLTNVIIEDSFLENGAAVTNTLIPITYITNKGTEKTLYAQAESIGKFIAGITLSNRVLPDAQVHYRVDFELMRDVYGNHKLFKIIPLTTTYEDPLTMQKYTTIDGFSLPSDAMFPGAFVPLYALCFNDGEDEMQEVYYLEGDEFFKVEKDFYPELGENPQDERYKYVYTYKSLYKPQALYSELYYRNKERHAYADYDHNKVAPKEESLKYDYYVDKHIDSMETLEMLMQTESPDTLIANTSLGYDENNPPPLENVSICLSIGEVGSSVYHTPKLQNGKYYVHGIPLECHWTVKKTEENSDKKVWYGLPIFKDLTGKRLMLPREEQVNPDKLVTLLNIKANISIVDQDNTKVSFSDDYYNMKANYASGTTLINAGQYESTVAIAPRWNLQFLSTDFWKHGQAGIIDIADDIKPTYWYGKQHPFEFEVVVVNDPSTHKIFQNLELVANKAKPESFHYEIIGECYDFAKDKPNMYFRQEALKALWQYNGEDISYNRNFLKVEPRQQAKSADFPHKYYARQDTINEVEDYYVPATTQAGCDYRHLTGAEIVYYPNRQEFRVWNHVKAVDVDDLLDTTNKWNKSSIEKDSRLYIKSNPEYQQYYSGGRSIIGANCQYLEDRWKITINPILICYKNEYERTNQVYTHLIHPDYSTWAKSPEGARLPKLTIYNSPIPDIVKAKGEIAFPDVTTGEGKDNALYNLYDLTEFKQGISDSPLDTTNWLNDVGIYKTNFGEAQNRKELDLKDKFMKVRIRYSGEELAVIDFLNTIYRVSYA